MKRKKNRNTDTMIRKTKSLILASLLVGALVTLLSAPLQAAGRDSDGRPADTFVILLSGPYKPVPVEPVVDCPDLELQVNLCDGSFSRTKIFRVSGLPAGDRDHETKTAIGNFYVQLGAVNSNLVAYDLPGGTLLMSFTGSNLTPVDDGQGGTYFVGTLDLTITEATGIYHRFLNGHNKMRDILHLLADGTFVEHCFCIISRPTA